MLVILRGTTGADVDSIYNYFFEFFFSFDRGSSIDLGEGLQPSRGLCDGRDAFAKFGPRKGGVALTKSKKLPVSSVKERKGKEKN